jgi:hypothetical protein
VTRALAVAAGTAVLAALFYMELRQIAILALAAGGAAWALERAGR